MYCRKHMCLCIFKDNVPLKYLKAISFFALIAQFIAHKAFKVTIKLKKNDLLGTQLIFIIPN